MHEQSLAINIIEIIKSSLEPSLLADVRAVKIRQGIMANVMTDTLSFAYHALTIGTELENSTLEFQTIPLSIQCNNCKKEFTSDDLIFNCPYCLSNALSVINGDEFSISELVLKE